MKNFPKEFNMKKVLCWNIGDIYDYNSEKLKSLLKRSLKFNLY